MPTDNGLLDTVLNNFTGAISGTWGPALSAYLLPLLMALVVLQFGMIAIEAAIARDVPLLLINILLGIIRVSIVVAIFEHAFEWGNDIIATGQQIGQEISGLTPVALTPSGVFDTGLATMQMIFHAKAEGGWLRELIQSLEFLVTGSMVALCWAVTSLIYLGCLLETAFLVYGGPLIIAFTPLSWTFDMLLIWGKSLLAIAFKVAVMLMTLAVGMALAGEWKAALLASAPTWTTDLWNLLLTIVEAIIFAYAVWKIPNRISGLTGGAAAFGFGEAVVQMAGSSAAKALTPAGGAGGAGGGGGGAQGGSGGGSPG